MFAPKVIDYSLSFPRRENKKSTLKPFFLIYKNTNTKGEKSAFENRTSSYIHLVYHFYVSRRIRLSRVLTFNPVGKVLPFGDSIDPPEESIRTKTEIIKYLNMIVKVEIYYELTREKEVPFPVNAKTVLADAIMDEIPNRVTLSGSWFSDDRVFATKLTKEQLAEKIRTGK